MSQTLANSNTAAPDRKVTARGVASREKVLEAALGILHRDGYGALSISAICKASGVSNASLYHHFGDKAGLLREMANFVVDRSTAFFKHVVADEAPLLTQIDRFLNALRHQSLKGRYNIAAVLTALGQARGESPETAAVIAQAHRAAWDAIAAQFARFIGGEDAASVTHLHMAFSSYLAQLMQTGADPADIEAVFNSFRRFIALAAASNEPALLDDAEFAAAAGLAGPINVSFA